MKHNHQIRSYYSSLQSLRYVSDMEYIIWLTDPGVLRCLQHDHFAGGKSHYCFADTGGSSVYLNPARSITPTHFLQRSKDSNVYRFLLSAQWKNTTKMSTCSSVFPDDKTQSHQLGGKVFVPNGERSNSTDDNSSQNYRQTTNGHII